MGKVQGLSEFQAKSNAIHGGLCCAGEKTREISLFNAVLKTFKDRPTFKEHLKMFSDFEKKRYKRKLISTVSETT